MPAGTKAEPFAGLIHRIEAGLPHMGLFYRRRALPLAPYKIHRFYVFRPHIERVEFFPSNGNFSL